MKRFRNLLLLAAVAVVVLLPVAVSLTIGWRPFLGPRSRPVTDRKFESTPARLERGRYLVNSVMGCLGCHSEPDLGSPTRAPKAGREGAGQVAGNDPTVGVVAMPNITPDKETGIGNWTDDEIARAIREGIDRKGQMLFPIMPYEKFKHMSDEDLASVVVYVRSLAPVRNFVTRMDPPFPINRLVMSVPEPITEAVPNPDLADPLARGTYLVTMASCRTCHTPIDSRGQPLEGMEFAGGMVMEDTPDKRVSLNITPDPSGISYFNQDIFFTIIRNGQYGARKLDLVMPWTIYRNMTDEDLSAVWTFVHSLKPVDHRIDNSMTPTLCPICGHMHGAGDKNRKR